MIVEPSVTDLLKLVDDRYELVIVTPEQIPVIPPADEYRVLFINFSLVIVLEITLLFKQKEGPTLSGAHKL